MDIFELSKEVGKQKRGGRRKQKEWILDALVPIDIETLAIATNPLHVNKLYCS